MSRARWCQIHGAGVAGVRYWTRGPVTKERPEGLWAVAEPRDLCPRCVAATVEQGGSLYSDPEAKHQVLAQDPARLDDSAPPAPAPEAGGEPSPKEPAMKKTCLVPGCQNTIKAKGRCSRHYDLARDGGWRDIAKYQARVQDLERLAEHRKTGQPQRAPRPAPLLDEQGMEEAAASVAPRDVAQEVEVAGQGEPGVGGDVAGPQAMEGQEPAATGEVRAWAVLDNDPDGSLSDVDSLVGVEWAADPEVARRRFPDPPEGYTRRVVLARQEHFSEMMDRRVEAAIDFEHRIQRASLNAEVQRLRDQLAATQALHLLRGTPKPAGVPHGPWARLEELLVEVSAGRAPMPGVETISATWKPGTATWSTFLGGNPA